MYKPNTDKNHKSNKVNYELTIRKIGKRHDPIWQEELIHVRKLKIELKKYGIEYNESD